MQIAERDKEKIAFIISPCCPIFTGVNPPKLKWILQILLFAGENFE